MLPIPTYLIRLQEASCFLFLFYSALFLSPFISYSLWLFFFVGAGYKNDDDARVLVCLSPSLAFFFLLVVVVVVSFVEIEVVICDCTHQ